MYIQNLTGNHPQRWERTGTVVEVRQFHQYVIKVDGSGRITLRNRQHLRKFTPYNAARDKVIESFIPLAVEQPSSSQQPSKSTLPLPSQELDNSGISREKPASQPNIDVPQHEVEPILPDSTPPPSEPQNDAPVMKLPKMLSRLQPHNEPGVSETAPLRRTRNR